MPAAKPAALKLLNGRGNGRDSAGRTVPVPPKFARQAPNPPDWLSEEARAEWDRVVPGLEAVDLLKESDRAMLVAYCETWDMYMSAVLKVRAEGMTIVNPKTGLERKHPVLGVLSEAAAQLRMFAREFGLTPAAEHALSKAPDGPGVEESDPYASSQ
jgi:P27 family predicted phage terminase small subunit